MVPTLPTPGGLESDVWLVCESWYGLTLPTPRGLEILESWSDGVITGKLIVSLSWSIGRIHD